MKTKEKISIRKNDLVKVIAGDQKGLIGKILYIDYKKNRAILDTAKSRKKYIKLSQEDKEKDKDKKEKNFILIPISIHLSNLMLWDEDLKKASRIGFKIFDEKKERYFIKSGNIIKKRQ